MAPQELAAAVHRRPFVPFKLTLTEGSTYEIRHPELCMVGQRSVILGLVSSNDPDLLFERSLTVDLPHIVKLEPMESAASPSTNGPA